MGSLLLKANVSRRPFVLRQFCPLGHPVLSQLGHLVLLCDGVPGFIPFVPEILLFPSSQVNVCGGSLGLFVLFS